MIDELFVREAGPEGGQAGAVLCLHANASSSSQWRGLMDLLAPTLRVLAPDGWGAGKSPPAPADRLPTLGDELAWLEPAFVRAGTPHSLVGHSHGGALALIAAQRQPQRVRSLVLYEPTLFALVDEESPPPNDADGIRQAVASAARALAAARPAEAARHFIDYWMGAGTFGQMPEARRAAIEKSIVGVEGWAHGLTCERTPLAAFRALEVPVLLMVGSDSPASSRAVARLLAGALPRVTRVEMQGLGHMGPVTHPERVNAEIAAFLRR